MTVLLVLFVLWVLFNLLAGYAPLMLAERISPGRLPADLLNEKNARVRFYVGENVRSYAFNVWAPPYTAVVFDRRFFQNASPDLLRFVIAHELGHAKMKHHIQRWIAIVSGLALIPAVRQQFVRQEQDADLYAEMVTGMHKSSFPQLK
jgi:Zn-dependent protease with chaperone function